MPTGIYERSPRLNLEGQKFGKLAAVSVVLEGHRVGRAYRWLCICECGKQVPVSSRSLLSGKTKSCGCLRSESRIPTCHPEREHCADGLCRNCWTKEYTKTYVYPNPERRAKVGAACSRKRNSALKLLVLTHYGPSGVLKCVCEGCEVTDIDMLTLDHKNDDGFKHKKPGNKNRMGGDKLYFWAKQNGFPDNLQTMCANHQLKKKIEKFKRDRDEKEETDGG